MPLPIQNKIKFKPMYTVKKPQDLNPFAYDNTGTSETYKQGDIVYKAIPEGEATNPIGVIIQICRYGAIRTEMHGHTKESEVRPATFAEIQQHRPQLIEEILIY